MANTLKTAVTLVSCPEIIKSTIQGIDSLWFYNRF